MEKWIEDIKTGLPECYGDYSQSEVHISGLIEEIQRLESKLTKSKAQNAEIREALEAMVELHEGYMMLDERAELKALKLVEKCDKILSSNSSNLGSNLLKRLETAEKACELAIKMEAKNTDLVSRLQIAEKIYRSSLDLSRYLKRYGTIVENSGSAYVMSWRKALSEWGKRYPDMRCEKKNR